MVNEKDMSIEGKIGEKELKRSTNVEIALQISSILTNKPNFMRFSPENDDLTKNKPN